MSAGRTLFVQGSPLQRPVTFDFKDDHLEYQGKFHSGSIRYEDISPPVDYVEDNFGSIQSDAFAVFVCLFAVGVFRSMEPAYGLSGLLLVTGALLCIAGAVLAGGWVIRNVFLVRRTRIPTATIELMVNHDRNRDAILDEIERRRMQALRDMAKPDPFNTPEQERAKLAWLRAHSAIDDAELQFFLGGISSAA